MALRLKANRRFPSVPVVTANPENHTIVLMAMKEALDIGQRRTNDIMNSFIRVEDLVDLGLIEIDGSFSSIVGADLSQIAEIGDLTGAASGDFLRYDGTEWVNDTLHTSDITQAMVTQHGDGRYGELVGDNVWTGDNDLSGALFADGAEGVSGQSLHSQGPGLPPVWRTSSGGSIEMGFNFTLTTTDTDPGSQKLGFNTAVYTTVTELHIDILAFTNFDTTTILSLLREGNRVYIQQRNDASKAVVYEVTAAGTNNTGWWTIPVTHVNSMGTLFPANADLNCVFILSSHAGVGELDDLTDVDTTGAADGDVLTYDAAGSEWIAAAPTGGGGGVGDFSGASVRKTGTQAVSSVASTITWDSEDYDTDAYHDNATDNSRLTAPETGYYYVTASLQFGTAGFTNIAIKKNGSSQIVDQAHALSLGANHRYSVSCIVQLNAGEYVTCTAVNTGSGNVVNTDTATVFQIFQIYATSDVAPYLDDLLDVNAAAPADGDVLTWDDGASEWVSAAPVTIEVEGAHVERTSAQLIVTANVGAAISWETEVLDQAGFWTSGSPTQLTIPTTGWYNITAAVTWNSETGIKAAAIIKNGAAIGGTTFRARTPDSSTVATVNAVAANLYLTAADYIEIWAYNNTASRNIQSAVCSIVKLPAAMAGGGGGSGSGVSKQRATWVRGGEAVEVPTVDVSDYYSEEAAITGIVILTQGGAGSCEIDIWKTPIGSYPASVGDSICSVKPSITAGTNLVDTALAGLTTTAVNIGDTLTLHLNSSSVFTVINVIIILGPAP